MPQFDLLILNSQSLTFINLMSLFYIINICYYIVPSNKTEKYRSKIMSKTFLFKIIFNEVCIKSSLVFKNCYAFHLNSK